jgi:hypothetical protein
MGSRVRDHRQGRAEEVTHSRRSLGALPLTRAAEKARERLIAFRNRKRVEGAQLASEGLASNAAPADPPPRRDAPPPPQSPFANYDSISTPEGASWPADPTGYSRYMVWRLPIGRV